MAEIVGSRWSIPQILTALPGLRRLDDGTDLLACRVAGFSPPRAAYIYLYGDDPNVIRFDLEDESADTSEWDNAIRRGQTVSLSELRKAVLSWVNAVPYPSPTVS